MSKRLFSAAAILTMAMLQGGPAPAQEPTCLEPREPKCVDAELSGWITDEPSQLACQDDLAQYTVQLRDYVNCVSANAQARIGEAYQKYNCKVRRDRECL
ncbi:MAG: hypothetical protein V3U18_02900 [Alphaproteobacteria bacterium]